MPHQGRDLVDPKNDSAHRPLFIPISLVPILRRHRGATRTAASTEILTPWPPSIPFGGVVFARGDGGPIRPDRLTKAVPAVAANAGIGHWTHHELRHAAGTLLLKGGSDLRVVSEALGHSSVAFTADASTKVLPQARKQVAAAIEKEIDTNGSFGYRMATPASGTRHMDRPGMTRSP